MAMFKMVEYNKAQPEIKAVYDEIMATRKMDFVNNFWKTLATQPGLLRRVWANAKETMAPGKIDALTKEMIYVAVSITNGCDYCIHSHTAAAKSKGMTEEMFGELISVVGLANQTNSLADGFRIPVDDQFETAF
jgi:AhpD family alkylhydroperoxidase